MTSSQSHSSQRGKSFLRAFGLVLVVLIGCAGSAVAEDSSVGPSVVMGEGGESDRLVVEQEMLSEEMAEVAGAKSAEASSSQVSSATSATSSVELTSTEPQPTQAASSEPSVASSTVEDPESSVSKAVAPVKTATSEVSSQTSEAPIAQESVEATTMESSNEPEQASEEATSAAERAEDAVDSDALPGVSPEGIPDANDPLFAWMSEESTTFAAPTNSEEAAPSSDSAEESAAASSTAAHPSASRLSVRSLAQPMALAANLTCAPGSYYSVGLDGAVYRASKSSTSYTAPTSAFKFNRATLRASNGVSYYGDQVNALGINSDGSVAYALDRWDWANTVDILKYSTATGTSSPVKRITVRAPRGTNFNTSGIVGGAVRKDAGNNDYYFGGFTTGQSSSRYWVPPKYEWRDFYDQYNRYLYSDWVQVSGGYYQTVTEWSVRFNLWRYDAETNTVAYLGYTPIATSTNQLPPANGDISFDAEGNLYVLYSTTASSKIVPITKESLLAAEALVRPGVDDQTTNEYYELKAQTTPPLQGSVSPYYGMTFIADGTVIAQSDDLNGNPMYYNIDPATGRVLSRSTGYLNAGEHTDTAGCNSFPTITLEKDFNRSNENHEMKLEILQKGITTPVGSAVTNGLEANGSLKEGLQDEFAGPVPARAGYTYVVRETGTVREGTTGIAPAFDEYNVSLRCVDQTTGTTLPVTNTSTSNPPVRQYEVTIPNSTTSVANVSCKYVNTAKQGALRFNKTDEALYGGVSFLKGSEWELVQTDAPAGTTPRKFVLKDCVAETKAGCPIEFGDIDFTAGQFLVDNIPYGKYQLVETKAPIGYQLLKDPIPVTIDRTTVSLTPGTYNEKTLGNIDNVQITGSVVWQKVAVNPLAPKEPSLLGESTWTLTPVDANNNPTGAAMTIEDCMVAGCTAPRKDSDPNPGDFLITGIPSGRYALQETKAPLGFKVDPTIHYFDVPGAGSVNVGSFVNELIVKPTLPKTGSYGVVPIFALASLVMAAGLALGMRRRWIA